MSLLRIAGLDMTMTNLGAARFLVDLETLEMTYEDGFLVTTEASTLKGVRRNSDDLRRSREIKAGVDRIMHGCTFVGAEVPTGAQSARAAWSFGIAIGIMACITIPLIEVTPTETKMASVGTKTAKKGEIIAWAAEHYPDAPWSRYDKATKNHGAGDLHENNEHLADACAVARACVRTPEFDRTRALWLRPVAA